MSGIFRRKYSHERVVPLGIETHSFMRFSANCRAWDCNAAGRFNLVNQAAPLFLRQAELTPTESTQFRLTGQSLRIARRCWSLRSKGPTRTRPRWWSSHECDKGSGLPAALSRSKYSCREHPENHVHLPRWIAKSRRV